MIARHHDNKLRPHLVSKLNARRKTITIPITKLTYRRLLDRGSSYSIRRPSYKELFAKFQSRLSEALDEDYDDFEYEEMEDDVFLDDECSSKTTTTVAIRLYQHLFDFVSLRKIWDLLLRYIWTSRTNRSIHPAAASPCRKVVELEDWRNSLTTFDSDSEGEDLFQDCEEENAGENISDSVNFCFSPPAPSFVEAMNRPLSSLLLRYDAIFTPTPATPLTFTPATIQSNSSAQSSASNRARQADLSWDNYDLNMLPQSPLLEGGFSRWSSLNRNQRIPMTSCLKTLWSLDSPSYDQLAGLPIAEDVEEEDEEETNNCHLSIDANSGERRITQNDSRSTHKDELLIYKDKLQEGLIGLLDDEYHEISDLKDCNYNNVLH